MVLRKVACLDDRCNGVRYGYHGGAVSSHGKGAERSLLVFCSSHARAKCTVCFSMLENPTVAEILLRGACVVINMSLCRKRCVEEEHAEFAHPDIRNDVYRTKAVMLFVIPGVIESNKEGIT